MSSVAWSPDPTEQERIGRLQSSAFQPLISRSQCIASSETSWNLKPEIVLPVSGKYYLISKTTAGRRDSASQGFLTTFRY